jgi:hypothetical protein
MRRAATAAVVLLATTLASDIPGAFTVTKENVFDFYQTFIKLTDRPLQVAPLIAVSCMYPSPGVLEREKAVTGPHFRANINVFANPAAKDALSRGAVSFPEGAVIVKEKLGKDGQVVAVGGMIKRGPGSDTLGHESGEWEYFYAEKDAAFVTGHLSNCAECHDQAKSTDNVFGFWRWRAAAK